MSWLPYFSMAFANFIAISGKESQIFTYLPEVDNGDILVAIADFCMRVQEIAWVAVAGKIGDHITVIFRGGALNQDLGELATIAFNEIGSAGGHRNIARAEIPIANIPQKINIVEFLLREIADALDETKDTLEESEEHDE